MTKKEKRILFYVSLAVFGALWVALVAFGDVLGVDPEAKDAIVKVAGFLAVAAQGLVLRLIAGVKDSDGDGIPDELEAE